MRLLALRERRVPCGTAQQLAFGIALTSAGRDGRFRDKEQEKKP